MAEVLLSCEMLEDEMQLALQRTGVQSWSKAMTRFCWAFACAAMPWTVSAPAERGWSSPGSMTASGC